MRLTAVKDLCALCVCSFLNPGSMYEVEVFGSRASNGLPVPSSAEVSIENGEGPVLLEFPNAINDFILITVPEGNSTEFAGKHSACTSRVLPEPAGLCHWSQPRNTQSCACKCLHVYQAQVSVMMAFGLSIKASGSHFFEGSATDSVCVCVLQ